MFIETSLIIVSGLFIFKIKAILPGYYLGVSSPLQRSTSNDTPQVPVGSSAGAGAGRQASPLPHIGHPVVARTTSRTLALQLPLNSRCQDVVAPLDMAIIAKFSFLNIT